MAKAKTGKSVKAAKSTKVSKSARGVKKATRPSPKSRKASTVAKKAPVKASAKKAAPPVEVAADEVTLCRRRSDRRGVAREVAVEPKAAPPMPERRQKVARRRQIDPTTCERDYSDDEIEFMHALDAYKRSSGRMFPTCSEVLEVIRGLGYAKSAPVLATDPGMACISEGDAVVAPASAPLSAIDDYSSSGALTFESVLIG